MTAYIARRILFMIPTIFGIMLVSFVVVQFAPGAPIPAPRRAFLAPPAAILARAAARPAARPPR
jgi:ABC-type microcin C transport system permease subunit YejB